MRVLLRNARIGLYYAGRKHWVGKPDGAVDLRTVERAVELGRAEDFERMEIVVDYEDPLCELVLPVRTKKASDQKTEADFGQTQSRLATRRKW